LQHNVLAADYFSLFATRAGMSVGPRQQCHRAEDAYQAARVEDW